MLLAHSRDMSWSLLVTLLTSAVLSATAAPASATAVAAAAGGDGAGHDRQRHRGVVLRVRDTPFGKVLHEKKSGLAAYLFTREKRGGKPRCYGGCADAWPPIKTKGRPIAGSGVSQNKLGTVKRRRGGRMVTYDGRPLYFYVDDSPGVILCNDVFEFGGDWLVIGPDGEPASG